MWIAALLGFLAFGGAWAESLPPEDEALFRAAEQGNAGQVRELVRRGAHLESVKFGYTPLMTAAGRGWPAVVRELLQAGADPNACPTGDRTPLDAAIQGKGDLPTLEALIKGGADARRLKDGGARLLAEAASRPGMVRLLLDARAETPLFRDRAVLERAARESNAHLLEALIRPNVPYKGEPLAVAIQGRDLPLLQALLRGGVPPNAETQSHGFALALAAGDGWIEGVRALLDAGADPNGGEKGETPLARAVIFEKKEIVELLLARGADVNHVPARGSSTALGTAAYHGRLELLRLLLRRGADPNLPDAGGLAPLEQAGNSGSRGEVVSELLAHGARITKPPAETRRGGVFEDVASSCDAVALLALFKKGASPADLPAKSLSHCPPELFTRIMAAGYDLNQRDARGMTVLLEQASSPDPAQVTRLLELGADPNLASPDGETPLMRAIPKSADIDHWEVVKALLDHHADPKARDSRGRTALHRAAELGLRRSISLLVLAGADPDAPDGEGHTPGGLYWKRVVGSPPSFRAVGVGSRRIELALPGEFGVCNVPRGRSGPVVLAECLSERRERNLWVSVSQAPPGATVESVAAGEDLTLSEASWQGKKIPIGHYGPASGELGQVLEPEVWIAMVPAPRHPLLVRVWAPREYGVEAGWVLRGVLGSLRQPSPGEQLRAMGWGKLIGILASAVGFAALLGAAVLWLILKRWPGLRPLTRLTEERKVKR